MAECSVTWYRIGQLTSFPIVLHLMVNSGKNQDNNTFECNERRNKMTEVTPTMPDRLVNHLNPGAPALLLTAGSDGYPSSAYTWAVALNEKCVRFAVDAEGTALTNLNHSGLAGLHIIGPDNLAYLVKGSAKQVKEKIEAVSGGGEMSLWEMELIGVRDQSFPGVTPKPFTYEWPEDQKEAMEKMEQAVFAEMKG